MCKFSVIIPVYNTAKYLPKCFDSVLSQSFDDYEIIVVNDGSTDNSLKIIEKYEKRYKNIIKVVTIKNQGLSVARNTGVKNAKGEYLLFLDSDDYIEKNLLKKLNSITNESVDLVRFQIKTVNNNYKPIEKYFEEEFKNLKGYEAFSKIVNYHFVENAWCYLYNRKFFNKNKFKFIKGIYHEDFALIPIIIMKAKNVSSINYIGYNYVQRDNSIMTSKDYSKTLKKVYDFLTGFDYLYSSINEIDVEDKYKKIFLSFIANSCIIKMGELNKEDREKYIEELKKRNIYDLILDDNLKRKLKKMLIKTNVNLYIKLVNGRNI